MMRRFGHQGARALVLGAGVIALAMLALLPSAPVMTPALPGLGPTARGAYHIHSDRSDGSGTVGEIAAAAVRAGLHFIIVTDHGDGTRPPDPPNYRSGVLVIDAVELNTTGGHLVALGLPATPYPFAGEAADVIEDVHRLGGFGIAAHPDSPRPALRWTAWDAPIDGLEWINADSGWRDESRASLARAILGYGLRAPGALASLLDTSYSFRRFIISSALSPVAGCNNAHSSAVLRSAEAFASCTQRSLSGTTVAVRTVQTPGSLSSTSTCLPANCLPSEI